MDALAVVCPAGSEVVLPHPLAVDVQFIEPQTADVGSSPIDACRKRELTPEHARSNAVAANVAPRTRPIGCDRVGSLPLTVVEARFRPASRQLVGGAPRGVRRYLEPFTIGEHYAQQSYCATLTRAIIDDLQTDGIRARDEVSRDLVGV